VRFEIDYPAFWAWHDHSEASRRAQGCHYATYVGTWRSRFRVLQGSECITRFDEPKTRAKRSFCARCGTPLFYERASAPQWVNIPRALFSGRTGREPRYHLSTTRKNTADQRIAAPLLIVQGVSDAVVPTGATNAYVAKRCAAGQRLEYWTFAGRDHSNIVQPNTPIADRLIAWTKARFANESQASGCTRMS
jgi:hypothetical protein